MKYEGRIGELLQGIRPDRIPLSGLSLGFSNRNCGYTVASAYNDPEKAFYSTLWTAEQYGWELVPHLFSHTVLGGWDFGGDAKFPESEYQGALAISRFPATTEEAVMELQMPDPQCAGGIPLAFQFSQHQIDHGLPAVFNTRTPFCVASNICGTQQFLKWMLKKPQLCEHLLRMATEHILNVLQYWVDSFGAEKVFAYMSSPSESNQIISPNQFEQFALPYHVEYHERLRQYDLAGFFAHVCGEQNLNLPHLASVELWRHPAVLSFGHEVAIETAAQCFPDDIIFGNIDPAILQTGTPQEVYDKTARIVEAGKRVSAGFIFAPGCELPPMSPPFSIYQMTKAVNDHGWY